MSDNEKDLTQSPEEAIQNDKKVSEKDKVKKLKEEIKDLKSARIVDLANLDNIRKQYDKDFVERQKYAVSGFIKDLLPAIDTFNMALGAKNVSPEIQNWLKGFEMVKSMFDGALEQNGVKEIAVKEGDKFDSRFHHAIESKVAADIENDTIIKVNQTGYMINDRLLRPATVVVVNNNVSTDNDEVSEDGK